MIIKMLMEKASKSQQPPQEEINELRKKNQKLVERRATGLIISDHRKYNL